MTRNSTITLRFILPFNTSVIQEVNIVIIDYKSPQMYRVTKHLSDCEVDEKTLRVTLSAEETNGFKDNSKVKIQLQCTMTDGTKQNSNVFYKTINELLDEEVI